MSQSFAIQDFIQPAEDLPGDITAAARRFRSGASAKFDLRPYLAVEQAD